MSPGVGVAVSLESSATRSGRGPLLRFVCSGRGNDRCVAVRVTRTGRDRACRRRREGRGGAGWRQKRRPCQPPLHLPPPRLLHARAEPGDATPRGVPPYVRAHEPTPLSRRGSSTASTDPRCTNLDADRAPVARGGGYARQDHLFLCFSRTQVP